MSKSYQHEIPKARVNIALDIETAGATERKELPLKMLAVGDYGAGKNTESVQNRERISINKTNFDQVLKNVAPKLDISVANKIDETQPELNLSLEFQSMKDFSPEEIVQNIPQLKELVGMRNLLKDLKSNVLDNAKFRRELEGIINDQPSLEKLRQQLAEFANDDQK